MSSPRSTAQDLRDALHPLWRRLTADRTLSIGKIGILGYLAQHGPSAASTLAGAQKVSPQAITTAVRELEDLGLVARTPDEKDRRRIWIELTDSGRERLTHERAIGGDWLAEAIAARLTPEETRALDATIPVLHKLVIG